MANNKRYWTGLDDLHQTEAFRELQSREFPQHKSLDESLSNESMTTANTGRRDFLKFMGFSLAAATLAACETPVIKSIPYTNKPADVTPGVANHYASTFYNGYDYCNVFVKTREGRPIFINNNRKTGVGHANARVNSSVLGLYDSARLNGPRLNGTETTWGSIDQYVASGLKGPGRKVLLTNTIVSPSLQRTIQRFCEVNGAEHVMVDAISHGALRVAALKHSGKNVFPSYEFKEATMVASVGADFLGTWGDSAYYEDEWVKTRLPELESMSRLHVFESVMSLTGTNSDYRTMVKPSEQGKVLVAMHELMSQGTQKQFSTGPIAAAIEKAVSDLKKAGRKALVVSGINDVEAQLLVADMNRLLGAEGTTVEYGSNQLFQGDDRAFNTLVKDMNEGRVGALLMFDVNPAYNALDKEAFRKGLSNVNTTVYMGGFADETGSRCEALAPTPHWLESWNDLSIDGKRVDLVQPTIQPLFTTRPAGESFMAWSQFESDWYTEIRKTFNSDYTSDQMYSDVQWSSCLHDGYYMAKGAEASTVVKPARNLQALQQAKETLLAVKSDSQFELDLYVKMCIGAGEQAGNPMLQETPDPVTKVTWDNYVTMARTDMEAMGLNTYIAQRDKASVVKVTANGKSIELPAFMQPGQAPGTVGIALGYGRGDGGEAIGRAAFQTEENGEYVMTDEGLPMPIGGNVYGFAQMVNDVPRYAAYNVSIEPTGEEYPLAATQIHNTVMDRGSVVKETTLSAFKKEADKPKGLASWNRSHTLAVHEDVNGDGVIDARDAKKTSAFDMWKSHPVEGVGHRWGMTVDLSTCTGCSACVTACHIENNVPVVGKDEVRRHRDMHWLRIDRYYASDWSQERGEEEGVGVIASYTKMEDPSANPQTVHMPMMCQHCNHAPCETVCPVAATTHSNEGLNQMTYNRCIGTRYCANNCPYKVRRFNWFNYQGYSKFQHSNPAQDSLTRMVLNPDVTVRARGVIEKCSMCIQMIQSSKLEAKKQGVPLTDDMVSCACSDACPTNAISFGDLNDIKSVVSERSKNNRSYHALEEIGVQPNIFYMTKVRNVDESQA